MTADPTLMSLAVALGGDPADLETLGGASGATWSLGDHVMRVGYRDGIDRELAASGAASAVAPVPAVLSRVEQGELSAVLLERMPGTPGWSEDIDDARAERRGRSCGRLHEVIGRVAAPSLLPTFGSGGHDRLIHLDLHPFNVLFDEDDEVSAVLDWANAGSGTVELDRARTAAILFLDPTARGLARHSSVRAFVAGWAESARFDEIAASDLAWATEYLIADLARRHTAAELAPAEAALAAARSGVSGSGWAA